MGIFIFRKNMLRCPECGGIYEISDGYTKCFECGCDLISEDEYRLYANPSSKSNIVECPYCHSNDTKKISTTSRVISTSLFGLGSKKLGKQWNCNSCGSDF